MKDLARRLAALDPDAGAALRVIARFDQLTHAHAGLPAIVREAATLAGCPARLVDAGGRLSVRVEPGGAARPVAGLADPAWPSAPVPGAHGAAIWLECAEPADLVAATVLDRAVVAAATALRDTEGGGGPAVPDESGWVDLVTDAAVPEPDRMHAARRLGLLPTAPARAVAVYGAAPHVEPVPPPDPTPYRTQRAGLGPAVPVCELPSSWAAARVALRFTAAGSPLDPGPRTVAYDELGGLALLAAAVGPATSRPPDVHALAEVAAGAPWALTTLTALVETDSLRTAAATLPVHHSTLRYRLAMIERQLGWTVRDPKGRLRLHLALVLRRLHQNPV
ncbi:helix-turn-helix domain-containing protein [Plantactinospora sp. KBS50]|uniref:helix-turn-helix domain-containing protein n=1 Tax=Plantactinospora sp. KBS50 TaxID=2024580 RepID=UPI000BAAD3AD|nr:helix-turn-helix domain-containing protein [Plantactinospora sp. KBS50]ASW55040.1 hypothetical protein CIK06_13895 [Plantactinospora sp. KBS50]